ncbi:hypothetical protein [Thalassobaculum litoreum]|uniref:hypothetical protein n=1 Tax=Thalassobaculum litoreum TaxID=420996 RepID=UPI001113323C|nr:hypothetical protein [Thalassobaculum litoreum]
MRPIIVLTMGRSGSSMVAGCLALHGMWTGECRPADRHNPRGYFENLRINGALGDLYPGSIYRDLKPAPADQGWPSFVEAVKAQEGYVGGPWLVKTNAFAWPLWTPFDPVFVFVRRNIDAISASAKRHDPKAPNSPARWREIAQAHQVEMDGVRAAYGGFDIDSRRLADGDHDQLSAALEAVGLETDHDAVAAFTNPALLTH